MLGGEPVIERQRHCARRGQFNDKMTVAVERAEKIAAAMGVEDRGVARGARGRRPFGGNAVGRDLLDLDVIRQPKGEAARVGVASALLQVIGARAAQDFGAQRTDLRIAHR